jgi:hypothetical protein
VIRYGWDRVVDVYGGDGRPVIVESDEKLSTFLEMEATVL